jgi:hypothetical protein
MELWLKGGQEADLIATLRALPWPAAIAAVVDLLQASADPTTPYFVQVGDGILVEPVGTVTYASPLSLYRLPEDVSGAADPDPDASAEQEEWA